MADKMKIAVLGGTGDLGGGLVRRWAKAGHQIIIGSRSQEKADEIVAGVKQEIGLDNLTGMENAAAAAAAEIVAITVPFAHQISTLEVVAPGLKGKILIDATVPLVPPKVARVQLPEEDSAAVRAQNFLGDDVKVVAAFQNVGAAHLREDGHGIECDVLVSGDDVDARETVIGLVADAGMKGWHAGPLINSVAAEALTSILIGINKRYKIAGAGIRITGEPGSAE